MKRIVFCDIDGTLLNSKGKISEKSLYAIKRIQESGNVFTIVTARAPTILFPLMNEYNLNVSAVTSNSAIILDNNRQIIYENMMEKEECKSIVSYIQTSGFKVSICAYTKSEWLSYGYDDRVKKEETIVHIKSQIGTIDDLKENKICKLFFIGDKDVILNLENSLKDEFKSYHIVKSCDLMLELTKLSANKENGVKIFADLMGVDLSDCIAFGDSFSDVGMLKCVGHGYIMANANEEVKKIIKKHTKSNDEDGIYYALNSLGLI